MVQLGSKTRHIGIDKSALAVEMDKNIVANIDQESNISN